MTTAGLRGKLNACNDPALCLLFPLPRQCCGARAASTSLVAASPAAAQITVFDPTNHSQNLLTAARELQQINNQIQQLQNQAMSLANQAKNAMRSTSPRSSN